MAPTRGCRTAATDANTIVVEPLVIPNDCVDLAGVRALLAAREVQHIILSPGPGSPHTPADIGADTPAAAPATALLL